ncbi:MAG: class I SAM-dependent methyltransferase [Verrucomicrobiota bacterium]
MPTQETEGLLSPWIASIRLRAAADQITQGSVVLDLACGSGRLREFLKADCTYLGVDRQPPPSEAASMEFLNQDLSQADAFERIQEWLPHPPTVVTMLAFIEHVTEPIHFLKAAKGLLPKGGSVILTTPHPIGRKLHDSLASVYLCSRSGAAEHEDFLDENDLRTLAEDAGFADISYQRFLGGLNQLAVLRA